MATPANWEDDYEWELINDDGFVYRRKKPPGVDATSASALAPPLPDPAVEEKQRRERKKNALLKLKAKYRQEIDRWVHLSNTLKIMKQKSRIIISQEQKSPEPSDNTTSSLDQVTTTTPVAPAQSSSDSSYSQIVDELLLQVKIKCVHYLLSIVSIP